MLNTTRFILAILLAATCLAFAPPSGRPPTGPLSRDDPKIYDVTFEVALDTEHQRDARYKRSYNLRDAPIVLPIVLQNTFSAIDHDTLRAQLWLGSREDTTVMQRARLDEGFPHQTRHAVITVPRFTGQALRWNMSFRIQVWSSRIDDARAANIPWPQNFPDEVADGLKPQMFIESDHAVFKQTIEKISGGNLRMVPPYLAAKDIVRYCTNEVQVRGDGVHRGRFEVLHGLEIKGALKTARDGFGSPHDLVCVCIAMLRAAGIPARPVIGIEERPGDSPDTFVSWGEFFLPEVGWIPFDPDELRGKGIRTRDVRDPWSEFGTMDELNERIPLSFFFVPPAGLETPQYPAVWGWDPRPGRDPSSRQQIRFTTVSRGSPRPQPPQ